jgi:uncharacterized protein
MAYLLFRFLSLIFVIWLLRLVLAKVFGDSRRRPPKTSEKPSNNMVKDPVCGMYMDSRLAIRLENSKEAHYFCSEECKNKYLHKSAVTGHSNPPPV